MAEESKTETYGVGPSAKKMNIGEDVNQFHIVDEKGIAYQDGSVAFDPTDNEFEVVQDDADPIARAEEYDDKNDAKEQSNKAVRNIVKGR